MHHSHGLGLSQDSERLTIKYHGYIIGNRAISVRMPYCELKWEIPVRLYRNQKFYIEIKEVTVGV